MLSRTKARMAMQYSKVKEHSHQMQIWQSVTAICLACRDWFLMEMSLLTMQLLSQSNTPLVEHIVRLRRVLSTNSSSISKPCRICLEMGL
jgi:hypothetical protein